MALLTDDDQKRISAQFVRPARSTAVANANNGLGSVVGTIDVRSNGAAKDIEHRVNVYVLTKPPTAALIPNAKIGDICLAYIMDDAQTAPVPGGVAIYVFNTAVTAAGAVSGTASWRLVTMAAS
ncbi:MAG: hypothetical protein LBB56_04710 [Chitinispirillales bacterium]|jgi:hypothetical protein|nr:hypothetical protein [Chitinispirillales bacterium]